MRCCGGRQSDLTSGLVSWVSVAGGRAGGTRSGPTLVPSVPEAWGRGPRAPGEQMGRPAGPLPSHWVGTA